MSEEIPTEVLYFTLLIFYDILSTEIYAQKSSLEEYIGRNAERWETKPEVIGTQFIKQKSRKKNLPTLNAKKLFLGV